MLLSFRPKMHGVDMPDTMDDDAAAIPPDELQEDGSADDTSSAEGGGHPPRDRPAALADAAAQPEQSATGVAEGDGEAAPEGYTEFCKGRPGMVASSKGNNHGMMHF